MWKRSRLHNGDRVKVSDTMFVTTGKRLIKAVYETETKHGILLNLLFEPGPFTEEPTWSYKNFVSWASIHCGDAKLQTENGETIRAERFFERRY